MLMILQILPTQLPADILNTFCHCAKMKVYLNKTKIMVFRNRGCLKLAEKWIFNDEYIDVVPFYKYLGVYMTPKLSWSKTRENAAFQAKKSIAWIFRYQKSFGLFPPQDIFKLFDSIVRPILSYGAEIW